MPHIAIYLRVSTKAQDTRSQEPDLHRWSDAQDDPIVWYRDKFTGRTMERPGWRKLEAALSAGEVSKIVVWRLDRLGRTASGLTRLFDDLTTSKIGLVSLRDGIDMATPAGRLMANVVASVAQYETEVRAERVLAGQAVARSKGKTWGGWQKGRRRKVTEEQVRIIRRMKAENESVAAIARATGLSRPSIYAVFSAT